MKLKITLAGPKVHDVGYRVFLLKNAINAALPGLSTYNWEADGRQQVIALVEGDEGRIKALLKKIEKDRPELAQVTEVTSEPYEGEVGRTSEVAMLCSFVQLDKAIPLLLDMRDDLKAVRKTTDASLEEIRGVRKTTDATLEEIRAVRKTTDATLEEIRTVRKTTDATLEEIRAVRKTTDATLEEIRAVRKTTDSTLEEIKGMREDIQPGYASNFRQMQSDIKAIKERLGMP